MTLVTARATRCPLYSIAGAIIMIMALSLSALAGPSLEPVFNPKLAIKMSLSEIEIDGDLEDPGWQMAGRVHQFLERNPGDKIPPLVQTEVFVTYDEDNLYVAFLCHDDPDKIRATMCQRDEFSGDDAVGLFLDTYGDASWAYQFLVNPYGVQKDRLWTSVAGEDSGYDLIWESAARITDAGYQVEMAIPFASMRFPNKDVQDWKVDFWRIHPRESYHQYSWAAYDRDEQCWVCQWGSVDGIANVQPGRGLEILPTYVANQASGLSNPRDGNSPFDDGDINGELSFGAKYSISSDITAEATYNPDFSQIEADASQIDVNSTIALFYPERRPFFQEGADLFRTLFNSFYTRTINDPQFAAKVTGRVDGASFGFLSAYDENTPYIVPMDQSSALYNAGKSTTNALRGLKTLGNDNQVGFIVTDRRFDGGGSGTILAFDHDIRLSRSLGFDGQYIYSHTAEPDDSIATAEAGLDSLYFKDGSHTFAPDGETYSGNAFISRLRRNARSWNAQLTYSQVDPGYRTQTGYDPVVNYRSLQFWNGYNIYSDDGLFERITPQVYSESRWNYDGDRLRSMVNFAIESNIRLAQSYVNVSFSLGNEMYADRAYDGLWGASVYLASRPLDALRMDLDLDVGKAVAYYWGTTGHETSVTASFDWKPIDRLIIEPSYEYYRSEDSETGAEFYSGYISRTRFRFQATREASLRLVLQYDEFRKKWDVDPLLTYRLSPFSVFYIGSTYDYNEYAGPGSDDPSTWQLSQRQFFMKLQYLFQT